MTTFSPKPPVLSKFVELDFGSPVDGDVVTRAHGLGGLPSLVMVFVECVTADSGYSVGDRLLINPNVNSDASFQGSPITFDATNIKAHVQGTATILASSVTATAAAATRLKRTDWKIIVRAWA